MAARKSHARRKRKSDRPRLARTLLSTGLLVVAGFGIGLVVGAVWETPERVLPVLTGESEVVRLGALAEATGTTEPPGGAPDAPVPAQTVQSVRSPRTAGASRDAPARVSAPPPAEAGPFAIQVGSFTEPVPAWKLAEQLGEKQYEVYVNEGDAAGKPRWRVRVGPVATRAEARRLADRLKSRERLPTWILPEEKSG